MASLLPNVRQGNSYPAIEFGRVTLRAVILHGCLVFVASHRPSASPTDIPAPRYASGSNSPMAPGGSLTARAHFECPPKHFHSLERRVSKSPSPWPKRTSTRSPKVSLTGMLGGSVIQSQVAQAKARLSAARAFLLGSLLEITAKVARVGDITLDQRMVIRLASTCAIHQSLQVVDTAYHAAGSTPILEQYPFESRFRDIHTVSQQVQGRLEHFKTVGQYLKPAPSPGSHGLALWQSDRFPPWLPDNSAEIGENPQHSILAPGNSRAL
jgi:hypothetical protein